jgi:hypothetical protein
MYRIPRGENIRLFKYVTSVDLAFSPWDAKSNSTRELWRRLTTKKLKASNPKALVTCAMPAAIPAPAMLVKFVDGSKVEVQDCSTLRVEELVSQLNMAAARIDNDWAMEGKDLGDD